MSRHSDSGHDWRWNLTDRHVCLTWPGLRWCLSSAPLNGGWAEAEGVFNLRVHGDDCEQAPEQSLRDYAAINHWPESAVGLMTAASIKSFRQQSVWIDGDCFEVGVTCGLSNARRAGDAADWSDTLAAAPPAGTINLVLIIGRRLLPEAMAELLMISTEARAVALAELNIQSPVSGLTATGTGTDATVIVSGNDESRDPLRWCGKHTAVGEGVARMVIEALRDSIEGFGG